MLKQWGRSCLATLLRGGGGGGRGGGGGADVQRLKRRHRHGGAATAKRRWSSLMAHRTPRATTTLLPPPTASTIFMQQENPTGDHSIHRREGRRSLYVDAHCHLTHRLFEPTGRGLELAREAAAAGVSRICVNGLEPDSNTEVLALCASSSAGLATTPSADSQPLLGTNLIPACGIHPIYAPVSYTHLTLPTIYSV